MSDKPDEFSNVWWRNHLAEFYKQLKGVMHSINRCNAEYADVWERVRTLEDRCESLEQDLLSTKAEAGRLGEKTLELEERLNKAAEAYKKLLANNSAIV